MQPYAAKVNPFLDWLLHKGNQYFSELKLVARSKKNILPLNSQNQESDIKYFSDGIAKN